jgi:POT family proton-dependent oligopeptide transporter
MAIGIIIMGFGFFIYGFSAMEFEKSGSSSMIWLVLAYLFHTIGELCLSPVALSFITKLSPVKYASLMMGVYFAATGLGNKVAGIIGESASDLGEYSVFRNFDIHGYYRGIFMTLLKPLNRLTHGAEDNENNSLK